jgi:hypothetical protein
LCCARTIAWRSLRLQSTFSTSLCNMKQQDCSELRYHTAKRRYAINGSRCRKLSSFHATTAGLCSGLPVHRARRILFCVGTKSRDAARDRHFAAHPEDRGATLVVLIRKMLGDDDDSRRHQNRDGGGLVRASRSA